MANFQPTGIIHIGNVPFNNDYINVRLFSTKQEQTTWMLNHMTASLSKENYTYVRPNNSIRVQGNAEDLYTYDYVMFQNANYGTKWFYAFIIQINYINENCTEFVLELDVMQTWMFDYTLRMGYVEREHTNNDTIGANLNSEPTFNYNTIIQSEEIDSDFNAPEKYYIIMESTKWYSQSASGFVDNDPHYYQHIFTGSSYAGFRIGNTTEAVQDTAFLEHQISALNGKGYGNNIVSLFLFPNAYCPSLGLPNAVSGDISSHLVMYSTTPVTKVGYFTMPDNLDGYIPKNNKLFTFPYCYPAFCDINGHFKELKFELWEKHLIPGTIQSYAYLFYKQCSLDSSGELFITPMYYDGVNQNYIESFIFKFENRLSWLYEGFSNWLAQNSMKLATQVIETGIGVATNTFAAQQAAKYLGEAGLEEAMQTVASGGSLSQYGGIRGQRENFAVLSPLLQSARGATSATLNIANELYSASKLPNEKRGTSSGNGRFAYNINSYAARVICLQHQFAERLDKFFDRFGYATELIKIPNLFGRRSWNFVKMQNSAHYGNVPNGDMSIINGIFNRGVTFWHIDAIGDYTQSNDILSQYDESSSGGNSGTGGGNTGGGSNNEGASGVGDNTGGGSNNEGASGVGENTGGSNNENAGGIEDNTGGDSNNENAGGIGDNTGGSNNEGAGGVGDNTGGSNNENAGGIGDNTGGGSNNEGSSGIGDNTGGSSNNEGAGGLGDNTGGSNNEGSIFNP